MESRRVPARHNLPHAVAFFLHDQLSSLVVDLERSGVLSVQLELTEGEREELDDLAGEALWEWLIRIDRVDAAIDLTYRQLTAAVLSDASHFVCESLLASGKGKLTVAYSLLRKPFKENLLLLEWLCASPEDFLERFHGESIRPYVLNRLPKEKRLRIMDAAVKAVDLPGVDSELLWLVRYAKQYPNSLETLWTQATHLVTSVKASATEPMKLNFVFSQQSAIEEQWEHYYKIVPLLLRYMVGVAECVTSRFVEWDDQLRWTRSFLRDVAFMRYATHPDAFPGLEAAAGGIWEELAALGFDCVKCDHSLEIGNDGIDSFWLKAEIVCPSCGHEHRVWELMEAEDEGGTPEDGGIP